MGNTIGDIDKTEKLLEDASRMLENIYHRPAAGRADLALSPLRWSSDSLENVELVGQAFV